jgi:hypothetical protein
MDLEKNYCHAKLAQAQYTQDAKGVPWPYRKFIQHYRSIAWPLTQLLKKDVFKWDGDADKAFQQLQLAMT